TAVAEEPQTDRAATNREGHHEPFARRAEDRSDPWSSRRPARDRTAGYARHGRQGRRAVTGPACRRFGAGAIRDGQRATAGRACARARAVLAGARALVARARDLPHAPAGEVPDRSAGRLRGTGLAAAHRRPVAARGG